MRFITDRKVKATHKAGIESRSSECVFNAETRHHHKSVSAFQGRGALASCARFIV
jgi:hypothetical protein